MAADASIKANISGDASGLIAALEQAKQGVAKFGSDAASIIQRKLGMKDVFKGILQGVGIASVGQIVERLVGPFREAADQAQRIERYSQGAADALERQLMARKSDAQQVAALEKQMKAAASGQGEVSSSSWASKLRDSFKGSALGRIGQFFAGDADEAYAEKMMARQQRVQELAAQIEEKKAAIKEKSNAEEERGYKESFANLEKQKEAAKKLAEFERETQIEKANGEAKVNLLQEDRRKVLADIATYENWIREGGELFKDGLDDLLNLKTKQRDLEKQIADLTIKKASDEQIISNEIQKQNDMRAAMAAQATENTLFIGNKAYGASRSPEEIKRASDQELQEFVKRQKAEIQSIESGKGRGTGALADAATNFLLQGTVIARLQTDVMRALNEINMRSGLKKDLDLFGEAGARSRFSGDPLAFDKLVQEFVSDSRTTKEIGAQSNRLLEDIKRRLDGGILTLPTNVVKGGG